MLRLDHDSLNLGSSGGITAGIWFVFDGHAFPEERWSDFAVVILAWWVDAVVRMAQGSSAEVLDFMDGPYALECSSEPPALIVAAVIAGREKSRRAFSVSVGRVEFFRAIVSMAEELLQACDERGWGGPDLQTLEASIAQLRRVAPYLCES